MENVGILTAFVFGLLSFISPCVLPIVPGYLSFISGVSFEEMQNSENRTRVRNRILANSAFFIAGFSTVFIALGASATFIGQFLHDQISLISKIAGVVIIIFGLHMIGVFKIPFLNYEKRFHTEGKKLGLLGAFLVGLAFAFGWTPCIGPILAAILAIASQQDTVGQGIVLLTSYSLGLGIPFLLTGLSLSAFYNVFNKFKRHLHTVEVVGGVMLVAVGALIMTNYLTILSGYFARWFPFLNELG
ncbi:MAG: cytochrome c biogenesis protein CcdA [Ignavibacteriae bacterium]|nr:cytochrome c biogenesis protein CcdA [Ignavibacteria bacterium]MBI3365227.1 cytochrome c biogenesis protein CcdA [Ignavibacteriota bacterium]